MNSFYKKHGSYFTKTSPQSNFFNNYEEVINQQEKPKTTSFQARKGSRSKAKNDFLKSLHLKIIDLTNHSNIKLTRFSKILKLKFE
jgi:hypothetical protein